MRILLFTLALLAALPATLLAQALDIGRAGSDRKSVV